MILVDTSVWIDLLEGNSHWTKDRLKALIVDREEIAFHSILLLEVLKGVH